MSRTDRDQKGGHPQRSRPRSTRRRIREQAAMRHEQAADDGTDAPRLYSEHRFLDRRCIRCGLRSIDEGLAGTQTCPGLDEDEPICHTSTTP